MALFKNLYFDIGFLNPFKKRKEAVITNQASQNTIEAFEPPVPAKKFRELPDVSRRLLNENAPIISSPEPSPADIKKPEPELPQIIKKPIVPPPNFQKTEPVLKTKEALPMRNSAEIVTIPTEKKSESLRNSDDLKDSFFNSLYSHFSKEETYLHSNMPKELLRKNLFTEMQSFWHDKKEALQSAALSNAFKDNLLNKMEELQNMEVEWQKLQLQSERLKDQLVSKEILIEANIKHLKKSFKRLHLSAGIKPENCFVLSNGSRLKTLQELWDELKLMDDAVFNSHVNQYKNDFANWVNDIIGLPELAQNIRITKTKEQSTHIIEKWFDSI